MDHKTPKIECARSCGVLDCYALMEFLNWLRSKKKSYWRKLIADRVVNCTFWVQERGDRSLIVGLGSGILIVLFFKIIFYILVIAAVMGAIAYMMAEED